MKKESHRVRPLAAAVLALLLGLTAPPDANAAPDPANYRLTEQTMARLKAVEAELKPVGARNRPDPEADEDDENDEEDTPEAGAADEDDKTPPLADHGRGPGGNKDDSVEGIAAKVEANPQVKAALARQGLTPTDYALAAHALLHAGMFVMFEKSLDPEKAKALLSEFTPTQRDNIDIVRRTATGSR